MSSLSMALAGKKWTIGSQQQHIDPGTLNQWLRTHHGYVYLGGDWCNLNLTAPNDLEPSGNIRFISEAPKPSLDTLHSYIDHSNPIAILHVRNKTHFVLATGYVPGTQQIVVNDPVRPPRDGLFGLSRMSLAPPLCFCEGVCVCDGV